MPTSPPRVRAWPGRVGRCASRRGTSPISLDPANTAAPGSTRSSSVSTPWWCRARSPRRPRAWRSRGTVSDGGTVYTFRLKDNVKFHDGTALDAHAVKFSLDRATSAQAKANFTISLAGIYRATEVKRRPDRARRVDPPYAPLLDALAEGYHAIVSRPPSRSTADFDRRPSGADRISSGRASKSHVTLDRNRDYAWESAVFQHRGAGVTRPGDIPTGPGWHDAPGHPGDGGGARRRGDPAGGDRAGEQAPPTSGCSPGRFPAPARSSCSTRPARPGRRPGSPGPRVRRQPEELCRSCSGRLTPARTPLAPGTLGFRRAAQRRLSLRRRPGEGVA